MKTMFAALAAVGLLMAPAVASAAPNGREAVSIKVSTEGLDLTRAEDVERLRERASAAIARVCNPGDRLRADYAPDWQCRREMAASVSPTLLEFAQNASSRVQVLKN